MRRYSRMCNDSIWANKDKQYRMIKVIECLALEWIIILYVFIFLSSELTLELELERTWMSRQLDPFFFFFSFSHRRMKLKRRLRQIFRCSRKTNRE